MLRLWTAEVQYFNETMLKLDEKRVNNFVPHQAKCILEKLEKDGDVNAKFFFKQTTCFYEKCESYLDVYRHAYEGVTPHVWLNSSEDLSWQPDLSWHQRKRSTPCLRSK